MANRTHRSFTLRVENEFYLQLAQKAQAEGIPLNQMANRLLRLGLGEHISLDQALRNLLMDRIVQSDDPAVARL